MVESAEQMHRVSPGDRGPRAAGPAGGARRGTGRCARHDPKTIVGSGAAMNSNITGASTAMVGTSIAARRRLRAAGPPRGGRCAVVAQRAEFVGEVDAPLHAGGEQPVGARGGGLGCEVGGMAERDRFRDPPPECVENVGELLHHDSGAPVGTSWRIAWTGPAPVRSCIASSSSIVTSSSPIPFGPLRDPTVEATRASAPRRPACPRLPPRPATGEEWNTTAASAAPATAPISALPATLARYPSGVTSRQPARRSASRSASSERRSIRRPSQAVNTRSRSRDRRVDRRAAVAPCRTPRREGRGDRGTAAWEARRIHEPGGGHRRADAHEAQLGRHGSAPASAANTRGSS